jgi:NADH-quinone oxidoreductase subunit N
MIFSIPEFNLTSILPELILIAGAAGALFFSSPGFRRAASTYASFIIYAAIFIPFLFPGAGPNSFGGLMAKDGITLLFLALMDMTCLFAVILAQGDIRKSRNEGEYYSLILFALAGMHIMAAGRDLLVIFLGLEVMAIPLYILVAFEKRARDGIEGAVKYFLLGSFSSALFLLGLAFYYGAAGTTGLAAASEGLKFQSLLFSGLAFVIVGIGFKIAAAPFHMWAPDAYEGAPLPVAAFISVAPKIAALAVLLRLAYVLSGSLSSFFTPVIIVLSVSSMIVGNLAALRQSGLVRMLAYSGIAQAGYIMMGLLPPSGAGGAALSFYLLVYIFMNLGAFSVALAVSSDDAGRVSIESLTGLAVRRPALAFAMAVFMVSLAGLPPTGGFLAKFYLFKAGIEAGYLSVVIVAIVTTIISLFYYLRVVMVMFAGEAKQNMKILERMQPLLRTAIAVMVFVVFIMGILPGEMIKLIQNVFLQ